MGVDFDPVGCHTSRLLRLEGLDASENGQIHPRKNGPSKRIQAALVQLGYRM